MRFCEVNRLTLRRSLKAISGSWPADRFFFVHTCKKLRTPFSSCLQIASGHGNTGRVHALSASLLGTGVSFGLTGLGGFDFGSLAGTTGVGGGGFAFAGALPLPSGTFMGLFAFSPAFASLSFAAFACKGFVRLLRIILITVGISVLPSVLFSALPSAFPFATALGAALPDSILVMPPTTSVMLFRSALGFGMACTACTACALTFGALGITAAGAAAGAVAAAAGAVGAAAAGVGATGASGADVEAGALAVSSCARRLPERRAAETKSLAEALAASSGVGPTP
mmetsp:Transcript_55335/g.132136  ORF Transcript_55335/g.132136 Transcript_55335/m.132136 type:complete len:283 (+) Transcript_55335:30-878(+)